MLLVALLLVLVSAAATVAQDNAVQRVLLHLGMSGSSTAGDVAETTLAQLDAWRAESCRSRTFTVTTPPVVGALFLASNPLESQSTALLEREQVQVNAPLTSGWVSFEVAGVADQVRTAEFAYVVTCDDVKSEGSATITIPALAAAAAPSFRLSSRIEYSLSAMRVSDRDEDEFGALPSFELEIEGGLAPTLRLPPPADGVLASISASEDPDVAGKVSNIVRGSGDASGIELMASGVRNEVHRANPLSAHVRLSVDSPNGEAPVVSDVFSFTHTLALAPDIDGASPVVAAMITVANADQVVSVSATEPLLLVTPRITSVSPTNGPIRGGTNVRISGELFSNAAVYTCNFGGISGGDARFVSETALECTTPSVSTASSRVEFAVLMNGTSLPEMTAPFAFSRLPVVDRVVPSMGQVGLETSLVVAGKDFDDVGALTCLFEPQADNDESQQWRTSALRVDSTLVQCAAPAQLVSGRYVVRVSLNSQDYSVPDTNSSSSQFVVHGELVLDDAEPSAGPSIGGSRVSVVCVSPAWDELAGDRGVDIRVALNGIQFSQQSVRFQYYASPVVLRASPAIVPVNTSVYLNVTAHHLSHLRETLCRVDEQVVRAEYLEPERIRCGPIQTPPKPGTLSLHISLNSHDFSPAGVAVPVHAPVRLASVTPLAIARGANATIISVSGTGFIASSAAVCSFGSTRVAGAVVSRDLVQCRLPPDLVLPLGSVDVRVSLNGEHFSPPSSPLRLAVYDLPTFTSSSPAFGLSVGGERVAVRGTGFDLSGATLQIACVFGDARPMPAQVENTTLLWCVTPAFGRSFGEQNASLSFIVGNDRVASFLSFRYASPPVFTRALPQTIAPGHSYRVVLEGYRLSRSFTYDVKVGNSSASVRAQVLRSGTGITFELNARDDLVDGALLPVKLSQNGTAFVDTGTRLRVARWTRLLASDSVFGGNASASNATCRLLLNQSASDVCALDSDDSLSDFILLDDESDLPTTLQDNATNALDSAVAAWNKSARLDDIVCRTSDAVGLVKSNARVSCAPTSSERLKRCYEQASMRERDSAWTPGNATCEIEATLSHLVPSVGPIEGGTLVTLRGSGFKADDSLVCFVNDAQVRVTRVNVTAVTIVTPASPRDTSDTTATVRCVVDGAPLPSPDLEFTYVPSVRVTHVAPRGGFAFASTRVIVRGSGFQRNAELWCRLGDVTVAAQFVSQDEVQCLAPPHAPGVVDFSVTRHREQLTSRNRSASHVFEYIADPELQSVFPPFGSEVGGTRLLLKSSNAIAQSGVTCVFEASSASQKRKKVVAMPALRVADNAIVCDAPPLPPGSVSVRVKLHEATSSSFVVYNVTVLPRLLSIEPQTVLEGQRATIALTGVGLVDSPLLQCRFNDAVVVAARVDRASGRALCDVPPQRPGSVRVQVSINGQDVASDIVMLDVVRAPVVEYFEPSFGLLGEPTSIEITSRAVALHVQLVCRFVELNVSVNATNSSASGTRACAAPIVREPSGLHLTVEIRDASQEAVLLTAPFQYVRLPTVTRASPDVVLETQGTLVHVVGQDFVASTDLSCEFGSSAHRVAATRVSSNLLTCVAPTHRPERVQLRVCLRGRRCTSTFVWFQFQLFPVAKRLVPTAGYELERTRVTVHGDGFFNASSLACRFNRTATVAATLVNETAVECVAPALSRGCVPIDVVVDHQVSRSTRDLVFCYAPRLHVSAIVPANGPVRGKTRVLVTGGAFVATKQYVCGFGSAVTPAEVVSESQLFCVTPPSALRTVLFSLHEAGTPSSSTTSELAFRYTYLPVITAITPALGSETGMYEIRITGRDFVRSTALRCRFGAKAVVLAQWISETQVSCIAPPHAAGVVSVYVTNNLVDYSDDVVAFLYVARPVVLSFEPLAVDASETARVTLRGREFRNASSLQCIIGDAMVRAEYVSASEVQCSSWQATQASAAVGLVDLDVATSAAFAPVRLRVTNFAARLRLHPTFGSVAGGTPLSIYGVALDAVSSDAMQCRFCALDSRVCFNSTPARLGAEALECLSPPWPRDQLVGAIEIVRTRDSTASVIATFPFQYHERLKLESLHPSIGTARGGTLVTILGAHFRPSDALRCVIGDVHVVRATFLSDAAVACAMPPAQDSARFVNVSVSLNGVDVERSSLRFTYVEDTTVTALSPAAGPLSETSMIRLYGSNFVASPQSSCVVGGHVLPAIVHSASEATCVVHSNMWATAGAVAVGFSPNGQERTRETLAFVFYDSLTGVTVSPLYGGIRGGTRLTFAFEQRGPSHSFDEIVRCTVGDIVTNGTLVAAGQIQCDAPAAAKPGPARTRVSLNGQHFTDGPAFWFMEEPQFTQLYPRACREGVCSEPVRLLGAAFPRVSELWCRFGASDPTRAAWVSATEVACLAPMHSLGTVAVAFSMNGVDFVDTGLAFEYVAHSTSIESGLPVLDDDAALVDDSLDLSCPAPHVESLLMSPSAVTAPLTVLGMTPRHVIVGYAHEVTVFVTELLPTDTLRCRIGESREVAARMVTRTSLVCVVPSIAAPGVARLAISTNGVDFVESPDLALTLHAESGVLRAHQSAGSTRGGDVLVIDGRSFFQDDSSRFFCAFGEERIVPATVVNATAITCVVPAWSIEDTSSDPPELALAAGVVRVRVGYQSGNVQVFLASSPLEWTYYPVLDTLRVEPPIVFADELSAVTVAGFERQMPRHHALECVARDRSGAVLLRPIVSIAPSQDRLELVVNISAPGLLFFELRSGNYVLNDDALLLQVKSAVQLMDVSPRAGPLRGGTIVHIHARGLSALTEPTMRCVFGNESVAAIGINASSLWCRSPPSSHVGAVSLSLALLNGPSTEARERFTYVADEVVTAVQPAHVAAFANESLLVTGANFVVHQAELKAATCRIGAVVTPATVRSSTEVLCVPVHLAEGTHAVSVACDGVNYALSEVMISVAARMRLVALSPDRSPSFGGAPVSVFGRGFLLGAAPQCVFGNWTFTTVGTAHSSTRVSCPVPNVNAAVTLPLSLWMNGVQTNALLLRFDAPLVLTAVDPPFGFTSGGMRVTIAVTNAPVDAASLACVFGSTRAPARWIAPSQLECTTPPLSPGATKLAIRGSHPSVEGTELAFEAIAELRVVSAHPAFGSTAGGTRVVLTLSRQIDASMMATKLAVCAFDSALTSAVFESPSVVACVAPPQVSSTSSSVPLTLSLNGREFVSSPTEFEYFGRQTIVQVDPAIGTTRGGVLLSVTMDEVVDSAAYSCGFNASGVMSFAIAHATSRTALECVVVAVPAPSDVHVSVWMNGKRHSVNTVVFHSVEPPSVLFFSPVTVPESGGAVIRIVGEHFPIGRAPLCRFGERETVEGRLVTTTLLECEAPALAPGNYSLAVTWNSQEFALAKHALAVQRSEVTAPETPTDPTLSRSLNASRGVDPPRLAAVDPTSGSVHGGTRLSLRGSFSDALEYECTFDGDAVPATLTSLSSLTCVTPAVPRARVSAVGVRVVGDERTPPFSGLTFAHFEAPVVTRISPQSALVAGGDEIFVTGEHLTPTDALSCRFGDLVTLDARVVSDSAVVCIAPTHAPGFVTLEVSLNGIDFTSSRHVLHYSATTDAVVRVSPLSLPVSGGAKVTLRLERVDERATYECVFLRDRDTRTRPAYIVNATDVQCYSPAWDAGDARVGVLVNGQTRWVSEQSVTFAASARALELSDFVATDVREDSIYPRLSPSVRVAGVAQERLAETDDEVTPLVPSSDAFDASVMLTSAEEHDSESDDQATALIEMDLCAIDSTLPGCASTRLLTRHDMTEAEFTLGGLSDDAAEDLLSRLDAEDVATAAVVDPRDRMAMPSVRAVHPQFLTGSVLDFVRVAGADFVDSALLACAIGSVQTRAEFVSSTVVRCDLRNMTLGTGAHSVDVANNGRDFTNSEVELTVVEPIVPLRVEPTRGLINQPVRVAVFGVHFSPLLDVQCLLGESHWINATVVSDSMITCDLPAIASPSVLRLAVSGNGVQVVPVPTPLVFEDAIVLYKVYPTSGPERGGTTVVLSGEGFANDLEPLYCQFGSLFVPALVHSATNATCLSPPYHAAMAHVVSVSVTKYTLVASSDLVGVNADVTAVASVTFTYRALPSVISIRPSTGPSAGGTRVRVSVLDVDATSAAVWCRFGDAVVKSELLSNSESDVVTCVSPPAAQGRVFLEVSTNEVDFSDSAIPFVFETRPTLTRLTPVLGTIAGGTTVVVIGRDFSDTGSFECAFGTDHVPATWLSSQSLECKSPPGFSVRSAPVVAVNVFVNGQDTAQGQLQFTFVDVPRVLSVTPALGPVDGGTDVTIRGENIIAGDDLLCVFGDVEVPAQFVSAAEARCQTPPHVASTVFVKLVVGSVERPDHAMLSETSALFQYFEESAVESVAPAPVSARVAIEATGASIDVDAPVDSAASLSDPSLQLELTPLSGFTTGGTLVHIFGAPFSSQKSYSCAFDSTIVLSEVANATHVGCRAPAVPAPRRVAVKVSENGLNYSQFNLSFVYDAPLYVTRISPFGGDLEGGQLVTVIGGNFSSGAERLLCRFGDRVVAASVVSATTATCVAPPLGLSPLPTTPVQVALEVSSNGQDFSSSGVVFRYALTPRVATLVPNHGPRRGETEVTVIGVNFANTSSLSCRFGNSSVVQAATFIDSTRLTCVSPALRHDGDVFVEVSNYGVLQDASFTKSEVIYSYDRDLVIATVTPSLGPTTGNFSVALTGGPFRKADVARCRFGDVVVQAKWISFDEVLCMAPPHTQGVVALFVTQNDQDYIDTGLSFFYYPEQAIRRIDPVFGPSSIAGTTVVVEGSGFVNSSLLACRFGYVVTPGEYVSPKLMKCMTPPLPSRSGGLQSVPLSEHRNTYADPSHGSVYLFPDAHYYPQYWSRLVSLEVSNNRQDFSLSGVSFLYYQDVTLTAIYPQHAYDVPELAVFAHGSNFINSTALTCRMGLQTFRATFVTSQLLLCIVKDPAAYEDARRDVRVRAGRHALFEVSNNGKDFTSAHLAFEFLGSCPTGHYCPHELAGKSVKCPRGAFCPGMGNRNFTLCPRGTYQPQPVQSACLRCPVGYHCPHTGMLVPRICPAGFVCDVTGIEDAEQLCPEGHFCLEGTATTSMTCSPLARTGIQVASTTQGEGPVTLRRRSSRDALQSAVGARRSGCWNNETADFGLQTSSHPSRFWMELRKLPLAPGTVFAPIRGRFCLDDSCVRLADSDNYQVQDEAFDYASTSFALRRPVPCPKGTYCHPGTAGNDLTMKNYSTPQPCFESMYCPEGSLSPLGYGECAKGFYCPFGTRIPCPAGTYCPRDGHAAPIACPPGTFNAMVAQTNCTSCPVGFICPGFNRIIPVLCPAGYVCSKRGLASPNSLCPKGFYCLEGTATSDGFRNDTRLRPYPCKPGTYCLKGVVADEIRVGDYRYAQNCTEGFYCELGSSSPKGSGLCPPGFVCPSGTAAPIPTDVGKFAALEGTVSAAECAPGYYSPTIESTTCIPCPPGTSCENDGTAVATICGPGSYRGSLNADGISCLACPQGTWSKNWEIRGVEECIKCAPGTVCPIDGITHPCTTNDLPHVFAPLLENLSISECLEKGDAYFFGVLLEPWIDANGRGPHFLPSRDGKCYENFQPRGSVLYQRLADFHGPLYELTSGVPHQGYGDVDQFPPPNIFDRGSLVIDLAVSQMYDVARNCTQGFFHRGQWFPGTCEADIFCSATSASSEEFVAQAQPCPEGYVCDLETSAERAFAHFCPGGYVCGPGTTPDLSIQAPRGQLRELCPASKYCGEGTAASQKDQSTCPAGYFCPTGTMNPYLGYIANDALRRHIAREDANPFVHMDYTKYIADGDIRIVSAHDMRCFGGIDDDLEAIFRRVQRSDGAAVVINRAVEHDTKCARDHKWRHVELALRRNECDCVAQVKVVQRVYQLWKCTVSPSVPTPTIYDPNLYGWKAAHVSSTQCRFASSEAPGGYLNLTQQLASDAGVRFQLSWTESLAVTSYAALRDAVVPKYKDHISGIPSVRTAVDPFLYDLHHAINMVEHFGEETPDIVGFAPGTTDVLRLDACACPNLFKCPNGTTSAIGSDTIYNCVKTGSEILQRLTPIPLTHPRLVNGSDFKALSGMNKGIGSITLQPLEVATITINTTQLSTNITYKDHYQISVYTNCKPCPPRYKCDVTTIPPLCSYPDNENRTATALYESCMREKGDAGVCNAMPFFCEKRSFVSTDAAGESVKTVLPGCCACERREMPQYFEDTTQDLGFPDNKHGYLQFSIAAVERTELTIALELLHGLYVQDFVNGFTNDRFDLTIFTPSRADYTPATPSTNNFFAVIHASTYDDLMLPLNLPESRSRVAGTLTYEYAVEERIFIDRVSDIMVGDPALPAKRGFVRNKLQNTLGLLLASSSETNDSTAALPVIPPTEYFGLYPVVDVRESVVYSDTWWATKLEGMDFIGLPYLPFFSSCRGFDSHMWIAKLLESHPDCVYVTYDETVEVNQYPWKKKTVPNADKCVIDYTREHTTSSGETVVESLQRGISLACTYEENLEGGAEKTRWYEAPTGTTLFYLTKDPASPDDFVGQPSAKTLWGRSDVFKAYLGTDDLIAVKVGASHGHQLAVPQEVYLNLTYYQMAPGTKRLVEAEVNFGQLCTVSRSADIIAKMAKKGISPCVISRATKKLASSDYTLLVSWEALDWFALMNLFQFTVDVYLVFFTLVGILSIIQGMIIWIINRLFTKMKKPPRFRMKILLKNIAYPPCVGILLAVLPTLVACAFIYVWWYGFSSSAPLTDPSAVTFEGVAGDWLDQTSLSQDRVTKYKKGRVGVSLVVAGVYLLLLGSRLMVPETLDPQYEDNAYKEMAAAPDDPFDVEDDKDKPEASEFWEPRRWKQANLMLLTLSFMGVLLVIWEFSYSSLFTSNIYAFLVAFKVLRNVVEILLESFLFEKLLVTPFVIVLSLSESTIAMGSADFLGFTLFYFVNLSFLLMERLYFAPLLRHLWSMWPKWKLLMQRKLRKKRRRTREQKAQDEAEWRRVCETIDNQAAGVESVLEGVTGYCVVFTELFLTPVLLMFQVWFSEDTKMPELYGVKQTDLLYYSLFSLFIIPSNLVMGVFQLHTLELAHGWKIYEYVSYQKHRFATRDHRWQMRDGAKDESIHPAFQSLDLLCVSSQFYFLVTIYAMGIQLTMYGTSVFLRYKYNLFGDVVTLVVLLVVTMFARALEVACMRIGDRLGVWKQKQLDGTLDDEIAARLALGPGRQKDLERERLELQALNSERFRHRFMERNRPWILQHLVELFTPRTLAAAGADGRLNSEYVRDIYHELMNMGEGRRLQGDRSDISSDSEDELEKMRRNWSNVPVDGASKDIALYWLARARKRRVFAKLVVGIIANNKQPACFACQKSEDGGYTMHVDLANAEQTAQDPSAIDRLIYGFEDEFGDLETDADLWKAYFRKHATYLTLCNVCTSALQQKRLARIVKQPIAGPRKLRDDDFSSDEEDDIAFEPVVIGRGSVEGRVLSKWLIAARKKLGGVFPREQARSEMEAYAKKMRAKKARKGKAVHVDSDEEDPSKHWKLQLNEASRAMALRWIWQARDTRYAIFCATAAELRASLAAMCDKMLEVDDWFYGKELRLDGARLVDESKELHAEQLRHDEDMQVKVNQTQRDFDTFERDKREAMRVEAEAFEQILERERDDVRKRTEARELELLELHKRKEVEFAALQKQARDDGTLTTVLVNEHRAYLARMEDERGAEIQKLRSTAADKEKQKRDAFERKLALSESAIQNRKALAQHRVLSIRKEAMNAVHQREKSWQARASGWMEKAGRKISVREQEELEAKANEKKRRKRVVLAQ